MKKKQPNTRHGRAAIYARYSSHNQREASIEQQVKACRELAVRLGLDVVETYEDKAISGKSDRRPSFQRLLRDAEKGYFELRAGVEVQPYGPQYAAGHDQ